MLFLLQTPPTPPTLPPPSFIDSNTVEAVVIGLTILAVTTGVFFLLKPLVLALARRLEGRTADPALHGEVDHLREQIADLEPLQRRVQELEERVEFAERLLAQRRDQDLLPRGGES